MGGRQDVHASSFGAYVARIHSDEKYALLQIAAGSGLSAILLALAIATDSQAAGLALAFPLVFLGYAFEQWQDARSGRERLRQDVLALSNVLYQDATMINKVLDDEMIHEYLQNLLQAALGDEDFGRGYWQQAVKPFLDQGEQGFREDWRYCVDIAQLEQAVTVPLPGSQAFAVEPGSFWALGTVASYRQHVKQPADDYYVGCTFSLQHLPEWFQNDDFLLRELVNLSAAQAEALAGVFSDQWFRADQGGDGAAAASAAAALFRCELRIAGEDLEPSGVQIGERGIRWRYAIPKELRERMAEMVHVRIAVDTFQPRRQPFFPVSITHPTRHPTVQFTYSQTSLSDEDVHPNVFFSAEEPYRTELIERNPQAKRIELQTDRDDWVFAGSGCMFVWEDPEANLSGS